MLYGALVAGPDEVLFGRKGLTVLHDPKLSFGDMTDHGVHHHLIFGSLRSRLKDDVTQRDSLEAGDHGRCLTPISTDHDTVPTSCPYSPWFAPRSASLQQTTRLPIRLPMPTFDRAFSCVPPGC